MAIQVARWEANDGTLHQSMDAALKQDAALEVEAWLRDAGLCQGGEWTDSMILDALLEGAQTLAPLLAEYSRAGAGSAERQDFQPTQINEGDPVPALGAGNFAGAGSLLAPFRKGGAR